MHIFLSFLCLEDRVHVRFHYLHDDAVLALHCMPCTPAVRVVIHRVTMRRLRGLLHFVDVITEAQRRYDAMCAKELRMLGHRRVVQRLVNPCVLYDACTLYLACATGTFGGNCWFRAAACECGCEWWGTTCTPPRVTRRGCFVRDALDSMVDFCATCLRRRPRAQ